MRFEPFVLDSEHRRVSVTIELMTRVEAESTNLPPVWQTLWTSEYLADDRFGKYAAKAGDEVIALGAYEILEHSLVVHIAYMEAYPGSNPTMDGGSPLNLKMDVSLGNRVRSRSLLNRMEQK